MKKKIKQVVTPKDLQYIRRKLGAEVITVNMVVDKSGTWVSNMATFKDAQDFITKFKKFQGLEEYDDEEVALDEMNKKPKLDNVMNYMG